MFTSPVIDTIYNSLKGPMGWLIMSPKDTGSVG